MQVANDQNALPAGCVRCEYLESTGEQYIETTYSPVQGDELFIDYILRGSGGSVGCSVFSAGKGSIQFCMIINTQSAWTRFLGTSGTPVGVISIGTLYELRFYGDKYTINGEEFKNEVKEGIVGTNLFLFIRANGKQPLIGCIGKVTARREGEDIMHLIPILDPSGTPCMYDTVAKIYHYNKGTGQFAYKLLE